MSGRCFHKDVIHSCSLLTVATDLIPVPRGLDLASEMVPVGLQNLGPGAQLQGEEHYDGQKVRQIWQQVEGKILDQLGVRGSEKRRVMEKQEAAEQHQKVQNCLCFSSDQDGKQVRNWVPQLEDSQVKMQRSLFILVIEFQVPFKANKYSATNHTKGEFDCG